MRGKRKAPVAAKQQEISTSTKQSKKVAFVAEESLPTHNLQFPLLL